MLSLKAPGERGESCLVSFLVSGGYWPSLVCTKLHHPNLGLHGHMTFFLCVCLHLSSLKTPVILDSGPTLIQYDLILTNYICKVPYFQIRSQPQGPGVWISTYLFWRNNTAHKAGWPVTVIVIWNLRWWPQLDPDKPGVAQWG